MNKIDSLQLVELKSKIDSLQVIIDRMNRAVPKLTTKVDSLNQIIDKSIIKQNFYSDILSSQGIILSVIIAGLLALVAYKWFSGERKINRKIIEQKEKFELILESAKKDIEKTEYYASLGIYHSYKNDHWMGFFWGLRIVNYLNTYNHFAQRNDWFKAVLSHIQNVSTSQIVDQWSHAEILEHFGRLKKSTDQGIHAIVLNAEKQYFKIYSQ